MNQRIKEFLLQTLGENEHGLWTGTDQDIEKFTKLIVEECTNICEDIGFKHHQFEGTYPQGKKAGAFECSEEIKKRLKD